jgi:putative tryptophan/tyrosine transport system substrate-binding protein
MRRREFITLIGGAVAAWPLTAFGKAQRIAIVLSSFPVSKMTETSGDPLFKAFFNELRRLGYVEGQSLLVERYSGEGQASHYADLARDVVSRSPDVIISIGTNELTLDFKAATTTIPIVGAMGMPVEAGIVASLARPGGNITGVSVEARGNEITGVSVDARGNQITGVFVDAGENQWEKRVQMLRQVVPKATRLAFLQSREVREKYGPRSETQWMGVSWVGPALNHPIDEAEYRRVFAGLIQDRAEGVMVSDGDEQVGYAKVIVELAEKNRLPAIYPYKLFVETGGLMSYGTDVSVFGYNIADVVGQILKGAKPSEIPIRQATKFELVINLKTAKALGLTVPPELLATADEVIE